MNKQWFSNWLLVCLASLVLSACGGGSGGSDDERADPQSPVPVSIAVVNPQPINLSYMQQLPLLVSVTYDDGVTSSIRDYSVSFDDALWVSFNDSSNFLVGAQGANVITEIGTRTVNATVAFGDLTASLLIHYEPFDLAQAQLSIALPNTIAENDSFTPRLIASANNIDIDFTEQAQWSMVDSEFAGLLELAGSTMVVTKNSGGPVTLSATVEGRQASQVFYVGGDVATITGIRLVTLATDPETGFVTRVGVEAEYDNSNQWQTFTGPVVWQSSNQSVFNVDSIGNIAVVSAGSANLTVYVEGLSASQMLNFTSGQEPSLVGLQINPGKTTLAVNESTNWSVRAIYSDSSQQDVTTSAVTNVSPSTILRVSGGQVTGLVAGTASVTASLNGVSAQITFVVQEGTDPVSNDFDPVLSHPIFDEVFYFIVTDRFYDGDSSNNTGGQSASAGKLAHGYDKTDPNFYHGGDLAGIEQKIPYLKALGVTALWITPPFENVPVDIDFSGYHGYWIKNFMNIDPHLGGKEALKSLIDALHANGMKLFLDIVPNHTARRTTYAEGDRPAYRSITDYPYRDNFGAIFDPGAAYYGATFPELGDSSFPYIPILDSRRNFTLTPSWLNDTKYFHHRGVTGNYFGQELTHGELVGLDDLFTEHPDVVQGMIDIYSYWIREFKIDGYRIDAAKHINSEFFKAFTKAMRDTADSVGLPHFYMFGEALSYEVSEVREITVEGDIRGSIDFPLRNAILDFAYKGWSKQDTLVNVFNQDDQYITANTHSSGLFTFVSNHDSTRAGMELNDKSDDEAIKRTLLGHALMTFVRGIPVFFYGDEQGFTGDRDGSRGTRQDMMASQVDFFNELDLFGTNATMAEDNFDTNHPLFKGFAQIIDVYKRYPVLRKGVFNDYGGIASNNVYAFYRSDIETGQRYILIANNATSNKTATFDSLADGRFVNIYPGNKSAINTSNGEVTVSLDGLEFLIYELESPSPQQDVTPKVTYQTLDNGMGVHGFTPIVAKVANADQATVAFYVSANGGEKTYIGSDNTWPYSVYLDADKQPFNADLRITAVAKGAGNATDSESKNVKVGGAAGEIIIHYHRPKGDYQGWGIHYFGDSVVDTPAWGSPHMPAARDAYGQIYRIPIDSEQDEVGFIVTNGQIKDPAVAGDAGGDRFIDPSEVREIWLQEGDDDVYWQKPF